MEGHRSRPYLKWTALAAVALALLAVVLLFTLDLGFLRGTVEERVRQSTGRTFAIDGPLSIRLGRELRLSATDVELGNPAWAGEDRMLRIGQLDARLDTRSLITGPMVIPELRLSGLELALRQDREGRANWQFTDAAAPEEGGTSLLLEQLHLSDSTISLVSPRLDQPLRLDIAQLSQSQGEDGYLVSTLDGQLNNRPVRFEGRAGPYAQLLAGEQILIEGAGEFGQTAFSGTAQIDALAAPARPSFELTVTGPELSELTGMLGIEGLGEGPLDLEFSAAPGERTLDLKAIGRLGPLQVDAAAFVPSLQDTSNAQLDAHISGPNFGRLARLAGFPGWPERPFTLDAQVRRPGEGLEVERLDMTVADARLTLSGNIPSFPALAGAALSLSAEGRDIAPFESALGLSDLPRGAFGISGNVESGDEDSARLALDYRFPVATGRISGTLGGGADLLGTDLTISATGKDLRQLASLPEPAQLPDGPYELSTRLQIAPGSLGLQGF
jgi:hypothetical protein